MKFGVVTLFPEMIRQAADYGVLGRALRESLIELQCWNPRDYASDRRGSVDDAPYGGGGGMILMAEPLAAALAAARSALGAETPAVYLSPQGRPIDAGCLAEAAGGGGLILVAGRYEGVDERFLDAEKLQQWSIGDFVLSGGELPALCVIDAAARFVPGALGDAGAAADDSFAAAMLEGPHYTRPEEWRGRKVPPVLLGGDHKAIERWRLRQALGRTWRRRPDLLSKRGLPPAHRRLLEEFIEEWRRASAKMDAEETRDESEQTG